MKAFAFRLQQILAWRETELNVQQARLAVANAKLTSIESAIRAEQDGVLRAAALVPDDATGLRLDSWAAFRRLSQSRVRQLETGARAARETVTGEQKQLVECSRKVRVLENLKSGAQDQWRSEFERELATFADETFLQGISRRARAHGPDVRPPDLSALP